MDHAARIQLARTIAARLGAASGGQVVVCGPYGSAARGDDTLWSDLNLLVVTRGASRSPRRSLLYQGIAIDLRMIDHAALEALLARPGPRWPCWMGVVDTLQPLVGDTALVQHWRELGRSAPEATFRSALEATLPQLVFAAYGRIRACAARNQAPDAPPAAHAMLGEMQTALCLLNRCWVTQPAYAGLQQTLRFPLVPQDYGRLAPQLWQAHDLPLIVTTAGVLVANYWRLLTICGLNTPNYQRVDEIPLSDWWDTESR